MDADMSLDVLSHRELKPCLALAWTLGTFFTSAAWEIWSLGCETSGSVRWPEDAVEGPGAGISVRGSALKLVPRCSPSVAALFKGRAGLAFLWLSWE